MSATKVLDMAEKQGLLDGNVIADLRKQVAESKFVVTAEAIAKILVDHGHLTAFQARKLVSTALGEPEVVSPSASPAKPAAPSPPAPKPHESELGLADSSSHDEIVDMKVAAPPIKPPAAKPPKEKKRSRSHEETRPLDVSSRPVPPRSVPSPLVPLAAPPGLQPIAPPASSGAPAPPRPLRQPAAPASTAALQPIDPVNLDPLHAPAGPLTPDAEKRKTRAAKAVKQDPWKNPTYLLLGGGLFLALIVSFSFLYLALTRTPVAELFAGAEQDYSSGSLGAAREKYEAFLKKTDPESSDASLARVRLGMIDLRQASGEGRNPKPGIDSANRILPDLLKEERFDDCRIELRGILVSMAQASARAAQAAKTTEKRVELVTQTEEALKLVDNASYIPSSLRGEVQSSINSAHDVLKAARRSIDQDHELQKALAAMKQATADKDAVEAYRVRAELLRAFPALEADKGVIESTSAVAAMEKGQVKLQEETLQAATQDEGDVAPAVILSHTSGTESGLAGQFISTLVQGAVHGLDANHGKLIWRRYVGHDSLAWPQPVSSESGADILLIDAVRQQLLRVQAANGKLVWRLPLGQPFSPPVLSAENAYVTTADGRLVEIDLVSGQSQRQVQLPQQPTVSPAYDSRKLRLFQLGKHSTLFVLDASRLNCTETYYLGHKAGSIFVPPTVVLDHVLVTESPGDNFSLIHALAFDAESKKLKQAVSPIRLTGRVVVPLQVDRNRVVAVTDQGQVAVIQVDPANKERPVRLMDSGAPTGSRAALTYFALSPGRVFVTGERAASLEIQGAAQDLKSQWQIYAGDAFVAPPQVLGKVLLHVRRPRSSLATTIEACQADGGKTIWRTEIAAPITAFSTGQADNLTAITSRGRVYEVPTSALSGAYLDRAAYVPLPGSESMSLTDVVELGSGKLALLGPQSGSHALVYDPAADGNRTQQIKFSMDVQNATAPATFFQGGLALPQQTGQVLLLDPENGGHKAQPFQPALQPGQRIPWHQPAAIGPDGTTLAVPDGRRTIYRLTIRQQPQPHLESLGETVVESDVAAPLAAAGDTVYAVVRSATADLVVALQGEELTNLGKTPLSGRVRYGPVSAAGLVFLADEEHLHAFEPGGKVRWSQPLAHGLPALAPLAVDGDFIVVTRSGAVVHLAADSGQETAIRQIGQPAGGAAVVIGDDIVVAGADGALHTLPLPQKAAGETGR